MFSVILVTFQNEKGGERMGEGGVSLLTEILAFQWQSFSVHLKVSEGTRCQLQKGLLFLAQSSYDVIKLEQQAVSPSLSSCQHNVFESITQCGWPLFENSSWVMHFNQFDLSMGCILFNCGDGRNAAHLLDSILHFVLSLIPSQGNLVGHLNSDLRIGESQMSDPSCTHKMLNAASA